MSSSTTTPDPPAPDDEGDASDRAFFSFERGDGFDHFMIEEPLGRGGMGAVYKARDLSLDRTVAIKVLPYDLAAREELKQRFLREARAQAKLHSPWVTHIYFIGETPLDTRDRRSLYFVMELIEGGSLEDTLDEQETIGPERARELMIQTAKALEAAHKANVVHRDIKPGNLLLTTEGQVKVADFGLAKPVDDSDTRLTQLGTVVGSPHYMSPEQAMGDEVVDYRSDMYALGCTFFHALAGAPPFDGPSPFAVVNQHVQSPVPNIRDIRADVPKPLTDVLMKLMSKAPEERYSSYGALIEALEAAAPKSSARPSFAARGLAFFLDLVLAAVLVGLIGWPGVAAHLVYVTVAHAVWGQTLGKRLLHLVVLKQDGESLGVLRSTVRTLVSLWLPMLIGIVIATTRGTGALADVINNMNPGEVDVFRSWIVAIAVSNGVLSLLYGAGMLLAVFHPRGFAVHDVIVGSEVTYQMDERT